MTPLNAHTKEKVKQILTKQLAEINAVSGINSLILSVCFIDALAGFYNGFDAKAEKERKNKEFYNAFTARYLPEYADDIYMIRCKLTHNFSNLMGKLMFVDDSGFTNTFHQLKYFLDLKVFDIHQFRSKLNGAFENYFSDLEQPNNEELRVNFLKRFGYLGILEDSVFPALSNSKGEIIYDIDDCEKIPRVNLPFAFYSPVPVKK